MGKIVSRKYTQDIVVYAFITSGNNTAPYTLNNTNNIFTLGVSLESTNATEAMTSCYQYAKVTGVKLTFRRSLPEDIPNFDGVNFYTVYPMSFNIDGFDISNQSATTADAFDVDGNMKVQTLNEDSKPVSSYWKLPRVPFSNNYMNEWQPSYTFENTNQFYITLGQARSNLLSSNATGSGTLPIGILTVTLYTKWMHPTIIPQV